MDEAKLRARLKGSRLVICDVAETAKTFSITIPPPSLPHFLTWIFIPPPSPQ